MCRNLNCRLLPCCDHYLTDSGGVGFQHGLKCLYLEPPHSKKQTKSSKYGNPKPLGPLTHVVCACQYGLRDKGAKVCGGIEMAEE